MLVARCFAIALLALCGISVPAVRADTPPSDTAPKPEIRTGARLIRDRALFPSGPPPDFRGGFVVVSVCINEDGRLTDLVIKQSVGGRAIEEAALRTLPKWLWTPATVNGVAVKQCAGELILESRHGRVSNPVDRKRFDEELASLATAIDEKRFADAETLVKTLRASPELDPIRVENLSLLEGSLYMKKGEYPQAMRSFQKVLGSSMHQRAMAFRATPEYRKALEMLFSLEVRQQQYGDALATYETLREQFGHLEANSPIEEGAQQLLALRKSNQALSIKGRIGDRIACETCRPLWEYTPLRRRIAFDDVQGPIDHFEFRCQWRHAIDKVSTEKIWEVPESWGPCEIMVFGEPGSSFTVVEYPGT